ncbi:MAG: response regulator transcription factor [Lachnospiraceae bacterium]
MPRILIVEDDYYLQKNIRALLENEGYSVKVASNVSEAQNIINQVDIDLYLLDIMLPDGSGYQVCSHIRRNSDSPIIMLSAKDDEESVVKGLDQGADDYVGKPFKPKELMSRIRANLRRNISNTGNSLLKVKNLCIDMERLTVEKNGEKLELRNKEFELLKVLMQNKGRVFSRNMLLEIVWDNEGDFIENNTLSVTMKRLREKLGCDTDGEDYIETLRGIGYRFKG